jgi:hypothetical protein
MQSDLLVAEAEISYFPTKATHRNEKYSTNNVYEESRTEGSKSKLTSISPKGESFIKVETTHSATDNGECLDETYSRANPDTKPTYLQEQNLGETGSNVSPATVLTTSNRLTRHSNNEGRIRGNKQNGELDRSMKKASSAVLSARKNVKIAENALPQNDDDKQTIENAEKKSPFTKEDLGANAGNYHGMADYGNIRSSKVSGFDDVVYSSVTHSLPSENVDLAENGGRFIVPPPKYSNLYSSAFDHEAASSHSAVNKEQHHARAPSRLSLVPQQLSEKEKVVTSSSVEHKREITGNDDGKDIGANTWDDEHPQSVARTDDDIAPFSLQEKEKSIKKIENERDGKYEPGDKTSSKNVKVRRRTRQRRKQQILDETTYTDDEMSIENYGAVSTLHLTGLQERAHQAWKSRQRKNSNMRSKYDSKSQPDKSSNVSFGASDTIHHFDPGVQNRDQLNNEGDEDVSLDRSLNSEYTKTLESEVEDMIKDILLIGSPKKSKPGRRKFRYKPEVEKKLSKERIPKAVPDRGTEIVKSGPLGVKHAAKIERDRNGSYPKTALSSDKIEKNSGFSKTKKNLYRSKNSELQNCGDDKYSQASTISRESSVDSNTIESEKDTGEDPLNTMIGIVEGGLSVMTSAIGYALGDHNVSQTQGDSITECQKTTGEYDIFESCGLPSHDQTRTTTGLSENLWVDRSCDEYITGSKNALLLSKKANKNSGVYGEQVGKRLMMDTNHESNRHNSRSGIGSEFIRLATFAARSVHKLQGVEYDESVAIDMYNEVKKCHVTLELPLGSKCLFSADFCPFY